MAEEARQVQEPEDQQEEQEEPKRQKKSGFLSVFLSPKWLLIFLAISVVGQSAGFAYFMLRARSAASQPSPEVSLGVFRFLAEPTEGGDISSAEFCLHIALLSQVEEAARRELQAKRFRVQQAVEELTRRAHSGDFDDPLLTGLKRQLQEQINETLGIRVIADVIITDLKVERKAGQMGTITETADTLPWTEKPPG